MSAGTRAAFAAEVRADRVDLARAALLLAADFDRDLGAPGAVEPWLEALDLLAAGVPAAGSAPERLRAALGDFHGAADDYDRLDSSLLHAVLRRRRGLPILLSIVWTEVARRAGIEAHLVGLPGHFVVGLGGDGLVDPYSGGGPITTAATQVRSWGPVETLERVLANIRRWAGQPDRLALRLQAVELALLLPRHDAGLRRERGELAVRLGDFAGGAGDLEAYAEAVEPVQPELAEAVRRSARSARARLN